MAIKKKRDTRDYISEGFDVVKQGVGAFARSKIEKITDSAEARFMAFQDRKIKNALSVLLFGIAVVFFSLGALNLIKELFSLSNSTSFLIIGIVLVLIGIIVKLGNKKNKK